MREMPYVWTREELQILSRLCAGIVLREFGGGLSTWDGSPASCLSIIKPESVSGSNYWTFPYQTR